MQASTTIIEVTISSMLDTSSIVNPVGSLLSSLMYDNDNLLHRLLTQILPLGQLEQGVPVS